MAGISGSAITFDGTNQFVNLSQPVIGHGHNTSFTIEAWVRFSASGQVTQTVYSETATLEEIALRIVNSGTNSGNLQSYTSSGAQTVTTSPVLMSADAWHFVAATVKPGVGTILYVDGLPTITNAAAGSFHWPTDTGLIGVNRNYRDGIVRPFKGTIDEVSVYNTARTSAEILADMQRESLQICPVFSFYAAIGASYQVQATTNLADTNGWTTLATNLTITTIPEVYVDKTIPQPAQRFFRAVPQ